MQFKDYSPPINPTLDQQRAALQKGLGRGRMWAGAGVLSEDLLLDACLHDKRLHDQDEACRGDWLWHLLIESSVRDRLRVPIFEALRNLGEKDAEQLCRLGQQYAASGDEQFRTRLYEIVEQKPAEEGFRFGLCPILDLDGIEAFLFAARVRGERGAQGDWEWDDTDLIGQAIERFGKEQIIDRLVASDDAAIQRFHERWRAEEASELKTPTDRWSVISSRTAADVLRAAHEGIDCGWLTAWGKTAEDRQLRQVREALWAEKDPKAIVRLLRAHWWQPLEVFDPRLTELCRHPDEEVRLRAHTFLAKHAHPEVRTFALEQLSIDATWMVIGLFVRNYHRGDEDRILKAIQPTDDVVDWHEILYDILSILKENPTADRSKLGVIAYGETPCQSCRARAAKLLLEQQAVPEWMAEEGRWDADEETRRLLSDATHE